MDDDFKTQVFYEWVIEHCDEHGDILDLNHNDKFSAYSLPDFEVQYPGGKTDVALQRLSGNEADGLQERGYAYLDEAGQLPERFDCDHKVPARYRGKTFNTGG